MFSILSDRELESLAAHFDAAAPQEILRWAVDRYRGRIALACSFGGPTGLALLDMIARIDPSVPVFYLDTGLLFAETHALVARVERHYGIRAFAVEPGLSLDEQARLHGEALWRDDPDRCCELRKVEPQRTFLRDFDAWISGLRRDQLSTRRDVAVVERDAQFGRVKINPLARFREDDVWRYLAEHRVPVNALHARGYASIGCAPCTRAVAPGEPARAGRWSGTSKLECGLHQRPDARRDARGRTIESGRFVAETAR